MKHLSILLVMLLTSCVTYKDRHTGQRGTGLFFTHQKPQHTESVRLTVQVLSQTDLDKKCVRFGRPRACAINGTAYVQGDPQDATVLLSPEYINALPTDEGKAGDMLTDKLGLKLKFNRRAELGHEALAHILSDTHHSGRGTPHL